MLVHTEEQGYVAFSEDVAQHYLIVSWREIMVEQGFCPFVFEQVERNGGEPLGVDEDVGLSVGVFQFVCGLNHLLEIGCHGIGRIDRIDGMKAFTFLLGVMDRKRKSIRTQADG